ncbi:hypothetical protein L2755_13220 [Shewanella abyssi]|uniref:hypothetical protein n=1 Tax=Shewanella abyssi TaxID=311789 RepID=UPI00200BBB4C|nr:hypothetical protein [Shewanella abyssi]MCL1050581.1 hypothetical protein [Shewanella abyssi]
MNKMLIFAGVFNAIAALMHIGCIYFGAPWYRFFGAGEQMAVMAERGSLQPTIITSAIVVVFFIWSVYAFSAAGVISRLPLLQLVLIVIGTIYLIRGIAGLFFIGNTMGRSADFWLWSSVICLVVGLIHLIGLKQQWAQL